MKKKPKKHYEVFNMETGEWEKIFMTESQYFKMVDETSLDVDELTAEYDIVSRIIAHNMGIDNRSKESMD